jgi:hypothetical protein
LLRLRLRLRLRLLPLLPPPPPPLPLLPLLLLPRLLLRLLLRLPLLFIANTSAVIPSRHSTTSAAKAAPQPYLTRRHTHATLQRQVKRKRH